MLIFPLFLQWSRTVLLCLECRRDVPAGKRLAEGAKQSKRVIGSVPMTRGGRLCRNRGAKRGGGGPHPPLWGTFPMKPTNRRFVGFAKGETDFDKSKIWQNHRGRLLETDAQLGMPAIPRQRRANTTTAAASTAVGALSERPRYASHGTKEPSPCPIRTPAFSLRANAGVDIV